eukprot:TRINITY_DN3206_c0_g1_i1.p1 TRINITY_DN3206_c0_g1~~TRINITY_DN3206_c0_g1_i1.p1  ORF type:complete len:903 (+),score=297.55 TRINITY_DN3206_c0_g1_i1:134-2842(+)
MAVSTKKALLEWCQDQTRGYKDVNVTDFSTSWADGLALAALVHSIKPDAFSFAPLSKDHPKENIKTALSAASRLGFAHTIDEDDFLAGAGPDKITIQTYLSHIYNTVSKGLSHSSPIPPSVSTPGASISEEGRRAIEQVDALDKEIVSIDRNLAGVAEQHDRIKAEMAQKEDSLKDAIRKEKDDFERQLADIQRQIEEAKSSGPKEQQTLRQRLEEEHKAKDRVSKQRADIQNELQRLRDKLDADERERLRLVRMKSQKESEKFLIMARHRAEMKILREKLAESLKQEESMQTELQTELVAKDRLILETNKVKYEVENLDTALHNENRDKDHIARLKARVESQLAKTNESIQQQTATLDARVAAKAAKVHEKSQADQERTLEYSRRSDAEAEKRATERELEDARWAAERERLRNVNLRYANRSLEDDAQTIEEDIHEERVRARQEVSLQQEEHRRDMLETRQRAELVRQKIKEATGSLVLESKSAAEILEEEKRLRTNAELATEGAKLKERNMHTTMDRERGERLSAEERKRHIQRELEKTQARLAEANKARASKESTQRELEKKVDAAKTEVEQVTQATLVVAEEKERLANETERAKNLLALKEKRRIEAATEQAILLQASADLNADRREIEQQRKSKLAQITKEASSQQAQLQASHAKDVKKLQSEKTQAEQVSAAASAQLLRERAETERLRAEAKDTSDKLAVLGKEGASYDDATESARHVRAAKEEELKQARQRIAESMAEAEAAKKKLASAKALQQEAAQRKESIEAAELGVLKSQQAYDTGKAKLAALEKQLAEEEGQRAAEREDLAKRRQRHLEATQRTAMDRALQSAKVEEEEAHEKRERALASKAQKERGVISGRINGLEETVQERKNALAKEHREHDKLRDADDIPSPEPLT